MENLLLIGDVDTIIHIDGTGNELDNQIWGTDGNNVLRGEGGIDDLIGYSGNDYLDGGNGPDRMWGGIGDDSYVIDSLGDWLTESQGEGIDTVLSSVAYTLDDFDEIEYLILIGSQAIDGSGNALDNSIIGNSAANTLTGGAGADWIDGGVGADSLVGNIGDDTYVVDDAGDIVTESTSQGTDTVRSSITWILGVNIENLILTEANHIDGSGNSGANMITGNSGNNVLNGGGGADTMIGGLGNDTYAVDSTSDQVIENPSEGTDIVQSSVTWTLGANLEYLVLTGNSNLNGTGNALDNVLTGNSGRNTLSGGTGNDWLDGGGGRDTFVGGTGDDTFVIDSSDDSITENAGAGTDIVRSSIGWTLGSNLENLLLTGTASINGTGNTIANVLTGNAGNNALTGNAGDDTLDGLAGSDTLAGGAGNDIYRLGRGHGAEMVQENDSTAGNTDVGEFLENISNDQIWFVQSGSNLEVSIIGTADKLTVQNWYTGTQYRVEQFRTSDGQTLLETQVQNLVNAMAAFSPPPPGQETLTPEYASVLNPIIAANWQ